MARQNLLKNDTLPSNEQVYEVFATDLPISFTEDVLRDIFKGSGEISSVKVLPPKNRRDSKVGFIRFKRAEDADRAIHSINGLEVGNGVKIKVRSTEVMKNGSRKRYDGGHSNNRSGKSKALPTKVLSSNRNEERVNDVTEGKPFKVLVAHVESPVKFWAQLFNPDSASRLNLIAEELRKALGSGSHSVTDTLSATEVYGCKFSTDGHWYRCRVQRQLPEGQAKVRYVDFGNSEIVDRRSIMILPPSLAAMPPHAEAFFVSGVELIEKNRASELFRKGVELLCEAIQDQVIDIVKNGDSAIVMRVAGKEVDLPRLLLPTGSVKISDGKGKESTSSERNGRPSSSSSSNADGGEKLNKVNQDLHAEVASGQSAEKIIEQKLLEQRRLVDNALRTAVASKFSSLSVMVNGLRLSRSLFPSGDVPEQLQSCISMLLNQQERVVLSDMKLYHEVVRSRSALATTLEAIASDQDKAALEELIHGRDCCAEQYVKAANDFYEHVTRMSLDSRLSSLKANLSSLAMAYSSMDNVKPVASLEEALKDYSHHQIQCRTLFEEIQGATNECSARLCTLMGQFQADFNIGVTRVTARVEGDVDMLISDYMAAINDEKARMQELNLEAKEKAALDALLTVVINTIHDEVNDIMSIKEKIAPDFMRHKEECEAFMKCRPDPLRLLQVRKSLKSCKSKYRCKLVEYTNTAEEDTEEKDALKLCQVEEELAEIRMALQDLLVEERNEMRSLAKACGSFYPEISRQHPELGLDLFVTSNGLLQNVREFEHYSHSELPTLFRSAKRTSYLTSFKGSACVVKEIALETKDDMSVILPSLAAYSKAQQDCGANGALLPLDCVFTDKGQWKLYLQTPYMELGNLTVFLESGNLADSGSIIMYDVALALQSLHNYGIAYLSLRPENVLIRKDDHGNYRGVLAELQVTYPLTQRIADCKNRYKQLSGYPLLDLAQLKSSPQSDMYCFGGLILWVMCGKTSTFTANVLTDVERLVQDACLKDLLRVLLTSRESARLSSEEACRHPFFQKAKLPAEAREAAPVMLGDSLPVTMAESCGNDPHSGEWS